MAYFDLVFNFDHSKFSGRTEYRHALNKARQTTLRSLFTAILLGTVFYSLNALFRKSRLLRRNTLYMYQWLLLYWLKILILKYHNSAKYPNRMSQTDNASHIGGAIAGYFFGAFWLDLCCKYIDLTPKKIAQTNNVTLSNKISSHAYRH